MDQGQFRRERAIYLLRRLFFAGQLTEARILWIIRLVIVFGLIVLIGYTADIAFGEWYTLFIIPALLAAAGYWFNYAQTNRQQKAEEQRAQNSALQDYLSAMKDVLLDKEHHLREATADGEDTRKLVQARTLVLLSRLDSGRQGRVVRFLSEAGLINRDNPVIALGGTRRRKPRLVGAKQEDGGVPLPPGALGEYALTLGGANLEKIDLQGADFSDTDLSHMVLNFANLIGVDLTGADLRASLLVGADLTGAELDGATLDNATFAWANLYQANIAEVDLQRLAASGALVGAILPDGSRPYSVPPEATTEFTKHPESELAQRDRDLERLRRIVEQQTGPP